MAAQGNLKSSVITNLDATPIIKPSAGAGGPGRAVTTVGIAGPTTDAATTGGILRMVRVPSNCFLYNISLCQKAATTTASFDMGLYYSDSTTDGTTPANQAAVINDQLFGTAIDTHLLINWTSNTFEAGTYTPDKALQPLWQAAGLSTDPGGFFDITLTNKATISGAATMALMATYAMGG